MNSKPSNSNSTASVSTTRRRPLLVVLAAVAVIAAATALLLRAQPAPAVSGVTITGQPMGPTQLSGKPYLVNFWATSCVTCVKEMPDLTAVHQEFAAKGFQTIAVAMSYDRPDYIERFVADRALPFAVIHDKDNAWAKAYGDVAVTPTTFVVNSEGKIIKRYVGEPNFTELRRILAKELG
jgi:peroxiredoxin